MIRTGFIEVRPFSSVSPDLRLGLNLPNLPNVRGFARQSGSEYRLIEFGPGTVLVGQGAGEDQFLTITN